MNPDKFSTNKIVRATRMILSIFIGFAYVAYSGVSDGFWVYITISLVLFDSATIGGTMAKGSSRIMGTFIASVYALFFIIGFANNFVINIIAIVLGIFLSVYLFMDSKYTFAGLLTWTLPVLLINNNDIKSSFLRLFNIMVGAFIAYAMHRTFYPVKAHNKMLLAFKCTLIELNKLLDLLISSAQNNQTITTEIANSSNLILAEIGKFARFLEEARLEKFCSSEQLDAIKSAYTYIRHLYRLLNVTLISLDYGSLRRNDTFDSHNISIVIEQINLIIKLVDSELNKYVWPDDLVLTSITNSYSRHKTLQLETIDQIISEDINGVIFHLANFYHHQVKYLQSA